MAIIPLVNKTGPAGIDGKDGVDGATWLVGEGAPAPELGSVDDMYLDLDSDDIYQKIEKRIWRWLTNIRGRRGQPGRDGENGITKTIVTGGGTSRDGADGKDGRNAFPLTFKCFGKLSSLDEDCADELFCGFLPLVPGACEFDVGSLDELCN